MSDFVKKEYDGISEDTELMSIKNRKIVERELSLSKKKNYSYVLSNILLIVVIILGLSALLIFSLSNVIELDNVKSRVNSANDIISGISELLGIKINPKNEPLPPLVLFIVVDQLRSDLVQNAHYRHANTFTGVGHSTLLTGGNSATHGIVGNDWVDYKTGKSVYCCENPNFVEVSHLENITGSAPTFLQSTTLGDEFKLFTNESKVFSVSGKDRASILPGGHLGKSFWYSQKTGRFISSNFYYNDYPDYVKDWNNEKYVDSYQDKYWRLKYPINEYHHQNRDYIPDYFPYSKSFPKSYRKENPDEYYTDLLTSPVVDELTKNFAIKIIENENLGKRGFTDMIQISFSCTDAIQHCCGVNSIESEDNIYKVDDNIQDLISFVDDYIGMENTLIVLSADHGVDFSWEHAKDLGFDSGFINASIVDDLNDFLNETFGFYENFIIEFFPPNIYFNKGKIIEKGKTIEEIENLVVNYLMNLEGVYYAFSRTDLLKGNVPNLPVLERIFKAYHPKRGGNVLVVQTINWAACGRTTSITSQHDYDTYVPIFFAGKDIPKGFVSDKIVAPEDIAVTIATYYGLKAPSGSMGFPLTDVLIIHDVNKLTN